MASTTRDLLKQVLVNGSQVFRGSEPSARVVSLCYHSVHSDKPFATVTPEVFEEHLEWLTEHCSVGPLTSGVLAPSPDEPDTRPRVAITFDDGYDDNFTHVLPALVRHGVTATFFLTTGFLDQDESTLERYARERDCPMEMLRSLDWSQVREMRSAGMVFGAHGHTHRSFAELDDRAAREELRVSKSILEDQLSEHVELMAYPYGKPGAHFMPRTMELAEEAGFELSAAIIARGVRPSDSRFAVPRFFVARDGVDRLAEKVRGDWDVIGWWQEHAPIRLQRLVSPVDFSH